MSTTNSAPQEDGASTGMPLALSGQKLMRTMARMQGHAMRAALNMQIETLGFLKHRYEQDLKLVDLLTGSAGIDDAFSAYSEFWKETVNEYSDEAGKIVSISSRLAAEAASNVRRDVEKISQGLSEKSVA
jgi:Phasin protein